MTINHIAQKLDELRHSIIVRTAKGQCTDDAKDEFLQHVEDVIGEHPVPKQSWVQRVTNSRAGKIR